MLKLRLAKVRVICNKHLHDLFLILPHCQTKHLSSNFFSSASTVGPGLADGVKPIFMSGESMEQVVNMENAMVEESLVVTETVPLNSLLGLLTPVPITSVPSHMHTTPPPLLPLMSVSTTSKFDEILEAPQLPPLLFQQPASPVPQSPSLSPCQVLLEIIKETDYPLRDGILCLKRTKISFLREYDRSLCPIISNVSLISSQASSQKTQSL